MIEISVNNITKSFGFNNVIDNISFDIHTGEIIGLVGINGCGKSTLLKLIAREEIEDKGTISIRKNTTIGYLKQNYIFNEDLSVKELLYESVKDIIEIENKLRSYEIKMQSASEKELNIILNKYADLQEKFINIGGYEISEKVGRIISGFKLENILNNNMNTLSGGESRIVMLASIMIKNPDILLLDEPTNHLDIETLEWFEDYLINYRGTVLIISHDRYFLNNIVDKIILIENGKEDIYLGNYDYYVEEYKKRFELKLNLYKNQQKEIKKLEASAKKLREFGRLGNDSRFYKRANSIDKRIKKLDKIDRPLVTKGINMNLSNDKRSGNEVLVLKKYSMSIDDNLLLDNVDLEINYKDRICLMGKNGSGKSTFIRNIMNGNIKLGSNVRIAYIPQEITFTDEKINILEFARNICHEEDSIIRSILNKYMFNSNDIFKRLDKLSGGERVRLKLLELNYSKVNFIILDEPTNHLDIKTREILEDALYNFNGTILFVSHDRYFINKLVNKIVFINNKKFEIYIGNYDDNKKYLTN